MKRSRDDVFVSSQIKRPAISPRIEQSGQVQMSTASSAHSLTTTDALSYLKNVKEIFHDRRDKYDDFLEVMKDFKAQRIDTPGVILRVKELFKGNRDLILGFNTFLPKGYGITLPLEDEPFLKKKPVEFDEALGFVNKIKTRFQGDDVYKAFLGILNMYRKDNKSITEVYQEVAVLFQDHADLLVEFTHFLPETSAAASVQYAHSDRNHIIYGDDRGSPMTIQRPAPVDKKPTLYDGHVNLHDSENFGKEKEKGVDIVKNEWEQDYSLGHKRKSARRDDCAINQFHRGITEVEADFRDKVKDQLQDPEIDEKFSDCIRSFKSKFFDAAQFRMLVTSLLGTHAYVSEACEDFVTCIERNGSFRNNKLVVRSLKVDRDADDQEEKHREHDFRERERHDRGLASNSRDVIGHKMPSYASKEKFMSKPIQDLDLSDCERCTPSYRLLPENYPIPSASCRTEIGAKVLNDCWVSVTSGSEDYSFKHMRKNQYEESLSRCEDDRFELDMLLESVNATAKRVEELLDSMNAHTYKIESAFSIKDHLSALHLRCIERLYGDHGLDVMDVLRKNAPLALPVILTRLKQKQEEWAICRDDFNKVWAEIYAKNYHKSLDHRSFYFKQQDTKNLSAKALLAEIKEMSEKNQNEDGTVNSVASGYTQPTKPHMEFEYPNMAIHRDIYQLMKYSCGEMCTAEQRDKVMKIWTNFLEIFLGVPSKANNCSKQNSKHIGQENNSHADDLQPEDSFRAGIACASNGNIYDDPDNVVDKIGIVCKASPTAAEENSTKEGGHTNADCAMEVVPGQESEDGARMKQATCSSETAMEEANAQNHRIEKEIRSKGEQEEAELSPNRNSDTKIEHPLSKGDPSAGEIGEDQMFTEEAGEETGANGGDEGEESGHVSLDSENGDVSRNESADGDAGDEDLDETDKRGESEEGAMPISDRLLEGMKPLTMNVPSALKGEERNSHIFYGDDSFYLLFRLHHMLYDRMQTAKFHSSSPENKWRSPNDAHSEKDSYARRWNRFMDALHCLLNGSSDNTKFEDECRALIGSQSYILFTLDKLIHKLVKQLQIVASEEMNNGLLNLYAYERSRSPEAFADLVYHENARFLLPEDNLYRVEFLPRAMCLTMQLMKNEHHKLDSVAVAMDPYFASYLDDELLSVPEINETPGVFLKRSKKMYSSLDEYSDTSKAMEGLVIHNGVEVKVNCNSLRISYVFDTEDFLYRPRNRRRALYGPLVAKCRRLRFN